MSLFFHLVLFPGPLLVLIEYVPFGDLLGYLRKSRGLNDTYYKDPDIKPKTSLTSQQLMKFAWQIADGMSYLSSKRVRTLLNKVCFHNTPCEFPNTSRCVVVTHLFTALFHGLRKHTIACKKTQKVCYEYKPLCLVITHLKLLRCKCS